MSTTPFDDALGAAYVAEAGEADAIDDVEPCWVVRPGSAAEAAVAMRIAREHDLAVVARGLGRHMNIGDPPRRVDVVLSTDRLDRVVAHEPADMTVRVQAGCSLAELAAVLFEAGQWLPLDPPCAPETTVGGLLATNLSGPLRASQGTARDLLIGIRTIAPDGSMVSGGGRVVKNVAGYDLPKMHIGALGTLGLIVEATFKVRPRPREEHAVSFRCTNAERAAAIALEMRDACEPFWLQVVRASPSAQEWAIIAGAGGRPEEVEAALESHRRVAHHHHLAEHPVDGAATLRHEISDAAAPRDEVVVRVTTLPTRVGARLTWLRSEAEERGVPLRMQADVTSGVIRATLAKTTDLAGLVGKLRPPIERDGGALVVERAAAAQKKELTSVGGVWGDPGPALPLMRGLKRAFDSDGRFSPGRFVGEL